MHIASCLNPKLIRHPYTHEQMYVPCGSCPACIRARSMRWVQRLNLERYSWKYCVFFTLTYDNLHLPLLNCTNKTLIDVRARLTPPDVDITVIDIDECIFKYSKDFSRDRDWLTRVSSSLGGVPSLSSYDLQKFIKRFRTYANRKFEKCRKSDTTYVENEKPFFRYFAIGEYGETLLRPHYHGLFFFNSEFIASHLSELVDASWKFGRTDSSFVSECNASYVAQYLNCTAHLPSIYRHKSTRPFFLCSKFPPIGTLCHTSKEVQKLFFECSPSMSIFDHTKGVFDNVPLWRTYIDRLYPRLSSFSEISHTDRVTLYGLVSKRNLKSFFQFRQFVIDNPCKLSLLDDYVLYLRSNCNNFDCALQRWYYISSRVCTQAICFGISVRDYVCYIEKFYENVEKEKLKLQFEWQDDVYKKFGMPLIGVDELYLRSLFDLDVKDICYEDLCILSSYGVDVEKFFSDDETVRVPYQTSLLPQNTYDYDVLSIDSECWLSRNSKTKLKNEYLVLHPDLKNIIY